MAVAAVGGRRWPRGSNKFEQAARRWRRWAGEPVRRRAHEEMGVQGGESSLLVRHSSDFTHTFHTPRQGGRGQSKPAMAVPPSHTRLLYGLIRDGRLGEAVERLQGVLRVRPPARPPPLPAGRWAGCRRPHEPRSTSPCAALHAPAPGGAWQPRRAQPTGALLLPAGGVRGGGAGIRGAGGTLPRGARVPPLLGAEPGKGWAVGRGGARGGRRRRPPAGAAGEGAQQAAPGWRGEALPQKRAACSPPGFPRPPPPACAVLLPACRTCACCSARSSMKLATCGAAGLRWRRCRRAAPRPQPRRAAWHTRRGGGARRRRASARRCKW